MDRRHTRIVAAVAAFVLSIAAAGTARAAIAVTNGDFESPNIGAGVQNQDVPDWFDSTGNFTSWHRGESADPQENGTQVLAMGPGGWVYQSLGTLDAAGGTLDWSLDKSRFADGNGSAGLNVRFFYGVASGTPADGTLITTLGLTQIGSTVVLDPIGSNSAGTGSVTETGSVDLTGLAAGTQLWLELTAFADGSTNYVSGPNNGFAPFDNISASVVAAPVIPTPAALPAGLAMIGVLAARRRR